MAKKKKNTTQPKSEDFGNRDAEKVEKKEIKGVKYYFKSEKELGFLKRNFHTGGNDGITTIIADREVDEKTYNKFSSYCKEVFFKS